MRLTADPDGLVATTDATSARFAWKDGEESHREWVDSSINYLRFGERAAFICPLTGANRDDLNRPVRDSCTMNT